jgi:hypothetical protein
VGQDSLIAIEFRWNIYHMGLAHHPKRSKQGCPKWGLVSASNWTKVRSLKSWSHMASQFLDQISIKTFYFFFCKSNLSNFKYEKNVLLNQTFTFIKCEH